MDIQKKRNIYECLRARHPLICAVIYRLYLHRYFFNFGHSRITGEDNKIDRKLSAVLRNVAIDIAGNGNRIEFGDECVIGEVLIRIRGDNNSIIIGSRVNILKGQLWIEDNSNSIKIGSSTAIQDAHLAVTDNDMSIEIGPHSIISTGVEIRTGDSHSILDFCGKRLNSSKSVLIGANSWIGANVSILKGVSLMPFTVVGTRSVVTRSIHESNVVIAGIPAKILKRNVTWCKKRI